ncbi:sensor histidine kinase [Winogradskyella poriferorum]|uniref:sensor histidine kinase n=1 Tax=Winogradskyella poriferorum TaxID=307627 RepID=UPI003D65AD5A
MVELWKRINKEYFLFGVLALFLFVLNSFDKGEFGFNTRKALYSLSYVLCALFIDYVLIPNFLYKKKTWVFSLLLILSIVVVIVLEEFVVEKILLSNTHGRGFNLFWTLLDVLPPLAFLVGFKFSWDAIEKQKKIDSLNRLVAESELNFLNSQINPHFLFNNLNNLYAYALENSPKTPKIVLHLASILRYMLYDCREDRILLSKEIENLKDYIQLNQLQFDDKGKVNFRVEGNLSQLKIAPLILMVFVENAFKHSYASQLNNILINISIKITDKTLYFTCDNNYSNNSNTNDLSKGIGLKNVKGRLNIIYSEKHELIIEDKNNMYKVFLRIELD